MADVLDVYDHEVEKIIEVRQYLTEKARYGRHNFIDFEREIRERYAAAGFTVEVSWYEFEVGGQKQDGAMPEVTITGRTAPHVFDKDRQVHEVTRNILELPGETGVIRTDRDTVRNFLDGNGGHGHGHPHPHPH